jgi:hypothetical protein
VVQKEIQGDGGGVPDAEIFEHLDSTDFDYDE